MTSSGIKLDPRAHSEAVKVIIRCRPMNDKEISMGCTNIVEVHSDTNTVDVISSKGMKKSFQFDGVYGPSATQEELYNSSVNPLVEYVLCGYNGSIFAYGQTGTGKTFTMDGCDVTTDEKGIIPRSVEQIFDDLPCSEETDCLVRASYLEIYQEEIWDLLNPIRDTSYDLREAPGIGVYIEDLPSFVCKNAKEVKTIMIKGNKNRSVSSTNLNDRSSRSHAIFIITIEMRSDHRNLGRNVRLAKLYLIDLAGSERQGKTGSSGDRLREATNINLSLCTLGKVIAALTDNRCTHIPYRESKLTRLLQDSLGGNSKTIMIANIGPASYNYEEIVSTLRYASRAKEIRNTPVINEDPRDILLKEYSKEIEHLKHLIADRKMLMRANSKISPREGNDYNCEMSDDDCDVVLQETKPDNSMCKINREKTFVITELEKEKQLLARSKRSMERLEEKILLVESKLEDSCGSIRDHTIVQQTELARRSQELDEFGDRETQLTQLIELKEMSIMDVQRKISNTESKMKQTYKNFVKWHEALLISRRFHKDAEQQFQADRDQLIEVIKDLHFIHKKADIITKNVVPKDIMKQIRRNLKNDVHSPNGKHEDYEKTYDKESIHDLMSKEKEHKNCMKYRDIISLQPIQHIRTTSDFSLLDEFPEL